MLIINIFNRKTKEIVKNYTFQDKKDCFVTGAMIHRFEREDCGFQVIVNDEEFKFMQFKDGEDLTDLLLEFRPFKKNGKPLNKVVLLKKNSRERVDNEKIDFLTEDEIEEFEKQGFNIGKFAMKGMLCIETINEEGLSSLIRIKKYFKKDTPWVLKLGNGVSYMYFFKLTYKQLLTVNGFPNTLKDFPGLIFHNSNQTYIPGQDSIINDLKYEFYPYAMHTDLNQKLFNFLNIKKKKDVLKTPSYVEVPKED